MFINTRIKLNGWQLCFDVQWGTVWVLLRRRHTNEVDEPYWYVMYALSGITSIPKAIKTMIN